MNTKSGINLALRIIGTTGLAGMVIVAPNAVQGLSLLMRKSRVKDADYNRILKELRRQGLVYVAYKGDAVSYTLTPAGVHRLQQTLIDETTIPKPKTWDKKWRVITFDIPVKLSPERAAFTRHLQDLGFVMLQKSLWIYPYPCFDEVGKIAGHYNILRYCTLLEADRLDELSVRRLLRSFPVLR